LAAARQEKNKQEADAKTEASPELAQVVGREDGVLLVNRGGSIRPATNYSRAGLGVGDVLPQGEGLGLETISPEPFEPEFPIVPMVVNRSVRGAASILPCLYSTGRKVDTYARSGFTVNSISGIEKQKFNAAGRIEIPREDCWALTRDGTSHKIPSIVFYEMKMDGYSSNRTKSSTVRFDNWEQTAITQGGCSGTDYGNVIRYSIPIVSGEPGEIEITQNLTPVRHTIQLAPGDTAIRLTETVSTGNYASIFEMRGFQSGRGGFFWTNEYYIKTKDSPQNFVYLSSGRVTWTVESYPSLLYSVSGSFNRLVFGGTLQITGGERTGDGAYINCTVQLAHPINPYIIDTSVSSRAASGTMSRIIPIGSVATSASYVSSADENDIYSIHLDQQFANPNPGGLQTAERWANSLDYPKKIEYEGKEIEGIGIGLNTITEIGGGSQRGVTAPTIFIPFEDRSRWVYTRDLTADPKVKEFKLFDPEEFIKEEPPGSFFIPAALADWREPLQDTPTIWANPCLASYSDEPFANINTSLYQANKVSIETALAKPVNESTPVTFTKIPISFDTTACATGTSSNLSASISGIGEAAIVIAAAGNQVPRKFGPSNA
jgi:hypothetical protein